MSIIKNQVKAFGHICQNIIDLSTTYKKGSHEVKWQKGRPS